MELLMMPRAAEAAAPGMVGPASGGAGAGTGSVTGGMPAGWQAGFAAVFAQFLAALSGPDGEEPEGLDAGAGEEAWAGPGPGPEQVWLPPDGEAAPVVGAGGPPGSVTGPSVLPGDGGAALTAQTPTAPVAEGAARGDSPLVGDSPRGQAAAAQVRPHAVNTAVVTAAVEGPAAPAAQATARAAAQTMAQTLTQALAPGAEQAPAQVPAQTVSPGAQNPAPVMAAGQQAQGEIPTRTQAPVPMPMPAEEPLPQMAGPAQTPVSEPRGAAVMPGAVVPEEGQVLIPRGDTPLGEANPQPAPTVTRAETPLVFATGLEAREAAAVETRSPAPLPAPAVQETIGRQVIYRVLGELEQLRGQTGKMVRLELQLHPPELGRVVVRLIWQTGGLEARFLTGDQTVRGAIEQALPQLREALGRQDVNLLDVSADLAREQQDDQARRGPRGSRLVRYTTPEEADDPAWRPPDGSPARVLDRLA